MRREVIDGRTGSLLVLVAACGGGEDAIGTPTPAATAALPSSSPTVVRPTATLSPEGEVLADYANYWEVYAHALRDRDAGLLDDVMTGPRLDRALNEVADLVNQGKAVELVVNSRPVVVEIDGDRAFVLDEYQNQSHFIDPVTKKALQPTPAPGSTLRDRVTLQRSGEVWKVMESVREDMTR
jgi:hypothetical protein